MIRALVASLMPILLVASSALSQSKNPEWDKVVEAVDWDRVFQIQSEFARGSLERSAQLTQRYLEVTQAVMTATASATRQKARKAA